MDVLTVISPLDGRYSDKLKTLSDYFSEMALIRYRLMVEIRWVQFQFQHPEWSGLPALSPEQAKWLEHHAGWLDLDGARKVKEFEKRSNHDVKAVEYYLRDLFDQGGLSDFKESIHLFCTSEDINNLAYSLMQQNALQRELLPVIEKLYWDLFELAVRLKGVPMLGRTHGQAAVPTTMGKELVNFLARLQPYLRQLKHFTFRGKFNGAIGNYNAHAFVWPDADWMDISRSFITSLGLDVNLYTTQIEPHDHWISFYLLLSQINTIWLDFSHDMWLYISQDYFKQRIKEGEVGSSTMPHKVNPIDFENAEGNLGLANSLGYHMAAKLPISRWQRDLSDSTVERNLGMIFGYSLLAYSSLSRGISKLQINPTKIHRDLDDNWQILSEAIQSLMRIRKAEAPYELLKKYTRGARMKKEDYTAMLNEMPVDQSDRIKLQSLSMDTYLGLAEKLVDSYNPEL